MNVSSSFIKSTNRSELVDYLEKATVVVDYGIRVVSIIGILFNLTTLVVLHNRKFKHKFYDFLRCRCVSYLFVCAIGSVYRDIPLSGQVDDYMRIIIGWHVINIPMRVVFFASGIIDVLLVLNRYVTLYNRKRSVFYTLCYATFIINLFNRIFKLVKFLLTLYCIINFYFIKVIFLFS